jgi:type II secretory pathway pseudopilin PulG
VSRVGLVLLGLLLAGLAATSRPFTNAADAETAAGFVLVLGPAALEWRRLRSRGPDPASQVPPPARASLPPAPAQPERQPSARSWPWLTLLASAGALELATYFAGFDGQRAQFPTISSFETALDTQPVLRGLLFLAWLALGASFALAGRPRGDP